MVGVGNVYGKAWKGREGTANARQGNARGGHHTRKSKA